LIRKGRAVIARRRAKSLPSLIKKDWKARALNRSGDFAKKIGKTSMREKGQSEYLKGRRWDLGDGHHGACGLDELEKGSKRGGGRIKEKGLLVKAWLGLNGI